MGVGSVSGGNAVNDSPPVPEPADASPGGVQGLAGSEGPGPKPEWLKKRLPRAAAIRGMEELLRERRLHTVCEGARCPNKGECFEAGTATFLIMGPDCSRNCRFCSVESASPRPLDPEEPANVADAAARMGLQHVVITSVTRDDLADGGAHHFVLTIGSVRERLREATIEVLVPDFQGRMASVDAVLAARPEVFNHNLETVPRLYPQVRPQANYRRSLDVLARAAARGESLAKTGLMVGLGETPGEVEEVLGDVRRSGVQMVTIGQYLRPSRDHLPVVEYVTPGAFAAYRVYGESLGLQVEAAPFVRSSYRAEEGFRRSGRGRQVQGGQGC